ncbi:MAG: DUF2062 domain-containing protein [Draconibacterium sp.]|nr:DUF2062 domain-containing protein [Draconibacterium sp.]
MSKFILRISDSKFFRFLLINAETRQKRALSLTLGFYLGIFPVFGTTTLLTFSVSMFLRLNHFLAQGMNLLATPLQLVMIYPFLKSGRLIFFNEKQVFPNVSVQSLFSIESWISLCYLLESVTGGIIVWAFTAIITFPLVYKLFKFRLFKYSGL